MNKKTGMTLSETLIVFTIIGIIATITMSSLKPWEKQYGKLYSRIYNAIATSLYNHMINTNEFPRTTGALCNALVDYMNTANNVTNCSVSNLGINPNDSQFIDSAGITLSNGTKLWFGGDNAYACADDASKSCEYLIYSGTKYFIVYADLNGDNKPNTINYTFKKPSDIIPFAVTDKFTVIPLSYPKIDTRYMQANVIYPPQSEDDEEFSSDPMPYYRAVRLAYGFGDVVNSADPQTFVLKDNKDFDWNIGSNFQIDFDNSDIRALVNSIEPVTIDTRCALTGYYSGATDPVCRVEIFEYH